MWDARGEVKDFWIRFDHATKVWGITNASIREIALIYVIFYVCLNKSANENIS